MENGSTEVHLVSLSKEAKSLRIVESPYSAGVSAANNGRSLPSSRTPSPSKKCRELMFIDDGTTSSSNSSSTTSTKEREKHFTGECDKPTSIQATDILRVRVNDRSFTSSAPSASPLPLDSPPPLVSSSPPSSPQDFSELTPAPSRRLPTVVVLGYQRAVVESQAAAERLHQQQQHHLQKHHKPSLHPTDCPLGILSSGLIDHGLSPFPHGRNNRVDCSASDDFSRFAQSPPPPQSPLNTDDIKMSSPNSVPPTALLASPSIKAQAERDQSPSPALSSSVVNSADQSSLLGDSLLDADSLWPQQVAEDAESIAESVYHQPPKAADRSAAYRLARRLFTLDGFKITDVAKHLCKRNDFSQLVGEEFASFFDFTEQSIDSALRHFMTKFALTGESQERERILFHFSRRYVACNPGAFSSEDTCHTLVCALMLLNTDLHSQSITRKMSCQEFVNNLMELNSGDNGYSSDELKRLYEVFKQEPLRWPVVELPAFNPAYGGPPVASVAPVLPTGVFGFSGMNAAGGIGGPTTNGVSLIPPLNNSANSTVALSVGQSFGQTPYWQTADPALLAAWTAAVSGGTGGVRSSLSAFQQTSRNNGGNTTDGGNDLLRLFTNPFADISKDISAKEYMRGFVMRKCVMESHGKRTAIGKRSWKLFYARLRDLSLYLYRDAEVAAAATRAEEMALGYMKQVYRFQLNCQHLRFYYHHHEQQQQQQPQPQRQQPQTESSFSRVSAASENPSSSSTSVKVAPTEDSSFADKVGGEDEKMVGATGDMPQANGSGIAMPSILEQQLAAAAFQLPPPPPPPPPPEGVICIAHALASVAEDYAKKPNVFRLLTKDGSEYLMQVNDAKELEYWVDKINYVAGLLSAPSLPSAVGSDQTFHRPILPAGVTHLGMHEQLEGHQKCILDLTRDLTELKRRRMSAPSQPNLTYLSKDSPAPPIRSELLVSVASVEGEISQRLQQPPSNTLPYIPDSVLKSLQPSSAATLPSSATRPSERTLSTFSTASLGRSRKKSFNSLRGGTGSELSAQRAELDERVAFLEHELTRYKTYSRLLEAELTRLQRTSLQTPASPQTPYNASNHIRGFWQVSGTTDLPEEPFGNESVGASSPVVSGLSLQAKRSYFPTGISGLRQARSQRMQYRQYQMHRRQQQQLQFHTPSSSLNAPSPSLYNAPTVQNTHTEEEAAEKKMETIPTALYEIL